MLFRSFGNRVAVHYPSLGLQIAEEEAFRFLEEIGYKRVIVSLTAIARELMGKALYRRGARMKEAPAVFDCSSFTAWLYGQRGILLPRLAIQQYESGYPVIDSAQEGDLVFCEGRFGFSRGELSPRVGHVGFVTAEHTVIHANATGGGVSEEPFDEWTNDIHYVGRRRILDANLPVVTLECPASAEIQTSDDILWKIL